jgi:hypothetical protein
MKLAKNLLDAVYQSFFATLDANVSIYVILLCMEILIFATIIPMQLPSWKNHYLYQQRILLLLSKVQVTEAENLIVKYHFVFSP